MRSLIILLVLLAVAPSLHAQSRNAAYFEIGGSGVVPTVDYERRLTDRWYGRVGASIVTTEGSDVTKTTFVLPVTVSTISHPERNHHLELGGGLTLVTGDRQDLFDVGSSQGTFSNVVATGILGYRYQKPAGGFVFRATFTPIAGGGDFLPWAGVSFGYAW